MDVEARTAARTGKARLVGVRCVLIRTGMVRGIERCGKV